MGNGLRGAVALAAAALLALTAAGCGGDDADGGKVKITWWHGQSAPYDEPLKKLAAEYSRAHPDVEIVPQLGTSNVDDMLQKVTAALAGGDARTSRTCTGRGRRPSPRTARSSTCRTP